VICCRYLTAVVMVTLKGQSGPLVVYLWKWVMHCIGYSLGEVPFSWDFRGELICLATD
jgi:hypothetical protein